MKSMLISLLWLTATACTTSPTVDADSCSQVQVGDARPQVDSILGSVGGGGGGDGWCHVWWGDYNAGPCCAVQLTACDGSGTVTAVAYDATGCASPGDGSSGGSSGGSSSGGSTGSTTPAGGGGVASLSITSDTPYDLPDTTFTQVNCDSENDGGMSFQYPDWGGTTFIVHGGGSSEILTNNVIDWSGTVSGVQTGGATVSGTLKAGSYEGTISISGTYTCP